jgi:hypothetical protein
VDNSNRLAAIELCLKLMGDFQEVKDSTEMMDFVLKVIVQALDSEVPKVVAGRVLQKMAEGFRRAK